MRDQLPPTEYNDAGKAPIVTTTAKYDTGRPARTKDSQSLSIGDDGLLTAPLTGPIRPLSPDTISVLSVDEYEQIRPSRFPPEAGEVPLSRADSKSWRSRVRAFWTRNLGLVYMLVAQIFGVLMNVTIRFLEIEGNHGKGLHPFQILFARMFITFTLSSTWMWYNRTPSFPLGIPEVRWLLVARGGFGLFGVMGMYYSLLYLPLADATVITFLAPGLACWACSILINEPFTRTEQLGGLVSLVGVILIARPMTLLQAFAAGGSSAVTAGGSATGMIPDGANVSRPDSHPSDATNYDSVTPMQRLSAVLVSLLGVLGAAGAYTTIRWIGKRAHPLISVNYFAAWCTFVSLVMMFALPGVGFLLPADFKEWSYLIFLGICGFILQFLLAAGLSYEKSSRATNMTYTQMLFALTFDKLVFNHTPGMMSIIGSSLILGSAIVVALQKPSTTAPDKESMTEVHAREHDLECQQGLMDGLARPENDESLEYFAGDEIQLRVMHQSGNP